MKKFLQIPLLLVALFLTSIPISAHDFEVDGIYYNITSSTDMTVEVTYRGGSYSVYSQRYTDVVTIPASVIYSGVNYSVTSIGEGAFYNCPLTIITIPNTVTSIGVHAFYGCDDLTKVNITDLSAWYKIDFGNGYANPLSYADQLKLNGAEITNFVIPDNITKIKDYTFHGYTGLTSVTIPNSVTSIGDGAFQGCSGLTSVTIPNSVTTIGNTAFSGCSGLTSVTIPNSVTTIGYSAFYGCTSLTSVAIPNSVTSISDYAFRYCALTSVTIGNSVTSIGEYAFDGCTSLTTVNYNATNCLSMNGSRVFRGCDALSTINIGNNVISIPKGAFNNCSSLTSVTIPNSVTSIGMGAFQGCSGLTSVTIPNSVTSIGDYTFQGCSGLTSVTIPNSVTSIGDYTFQGCSGLTSVTIPNSVTSIGNSAFSGCSGLTSVTIGNSVTSIGNDAFRYCAGLTTVTIGNSVTEIGNYAFWGCTGLTTVNYNATNCLSMNGYDVFAECDALSTINIGNNVISIPARAFNNCYSLQDVNITDLSAWCKIDFESYNANPLYYAGHLKLNGTEITNLVIPNDITEIKSSAFCGCTGLTSVSIPNSVTSIAGNAFYGCTGLLYDPKIATTQTTVTLTNITTPTTYSPYFNYSSKYYKVGDKIMGLRPGYRTTFYYGLMINDNYCGISDIEVTTSPFNVDLSGSVTASSVTAKGTYTEGDVTILGEGINYGSKVSEYNGTNTIKVNNLDPNSSYTIYYAVKTQEGGVYTASETYTTSALELTTQEAKPTSTTSVRLLAATNCDATEGTGFEWRRYDAPDELPSSKVSCPVVDGVLVGSLRGVKDDVYYKYRPYYTSSSGNTYYGEWIAFFTGDANVYFEPEVRTYEDIQVINNSATVKGYALEGTDVITSQGFEYWKTGSTIKPASTDDRMTVSASGISMSATLANLEYNSTYKYRAYVTTAKGTIYGDEMEFSTGEDPSGIGYIEIDSDEFVVTLRENPATGTAWVKIAGAAGEEVQYTLTSMSGAMVANGTVLLDGEWNAIDLNCSAGMYLLTINDGTQVKTLRLIVK